MKNRKGGAKEREELNDSGNTDITSGPAGRVAMNDCLANLLGFGIELRC